MHDLSRLHVAINVYFKCIGRTGDRPLNAFPVKGPMRTRSMIPRDVFTWSDPWPLVAAPTVGDSVTGTVFLLSLVITEVVTVEGSGRVHRGTGAIVEECQVIVVTCLTGQVTQVFWR